MSSVTSPDTVLNAGLESSALFTPTGWSSGNVENTLEQGKSIAVDPEIPKGSIILSLTVLPIHIYSNDPHPEPFPGLQVEFGTSYRSFTLKCEKYDPRDSIQFFQWQVTYGTAPTGYKPEGWLSGFTPSGNVPQKVITGIGEDESIGGVTVLPIHIYNNDPNPEPWPSLRLDLTEEGDFWITDSGQGDGPRDSIQFFEWQVLLAPANAKPRKLGWISGQTSNPNLPVSIKPAIPDGKGIVSVNVLPIHLYKNDPKPEPWPGLRVKFPTPDSFEIYSVKDDPRDSIDWFMWQVTYANRD